MDLYDMRQNSRISEVQTRARESSAKAGNALELSRTLQRRVDKLALICEAMWEMIRERTDLTEDDLAAKVEEIDLRDGKLDGKVEAKPIPCPKCNRRSPSRFERCLYCGQPMEPDSIFRTV